MATRSETVFRQAEPYRSEFSDSPQITIHVPRSMIERLRGENPHLTSNICEYLESGSVFYQRLLDFDGLMIHASALMWQGRAYLFSGPCGMGKSTHARLWIKTFGRENVLIINDDKPAVRWEKDRFYVYGTPWSGKCRVSENIRVPLGAVALLERGTENRLTPLTDAGAVYFLLNQTVRPRETESVERLLDLLDRLFRTTPVFRFECLPNAAAARMSCGVMSAAAAESTSNREPKR